MSRWALVFHADLVIEASQVFDVIAALRPAGEILILRDGGFQLLEFRDSQSEGRIPWRHAAGLPVTHEYRQHASF